MRSGAVGLAFDERGTAAAAGAGDGPADDLVHSQDIVAVDRDAGNAIAVCSVGDLVVAGGGGKRDFGGVEVVLADEDGRQVPNGGHVDALVEGAVADRSVAEESHTDAVGLEQLEGIAGARSLQDAGTDDSAGAHHADFGRKEVHAAAAAP